MKRYLPLFAVSFSLIIGVAGCVKSPDKGTTKPLEKTTASTSNGPSNNESQDKNKPANIDLNKVSADTLICTVNGVPITVGDYRRGFKLEEMQMQGAVSSNQQLRESLLDSAKKNNVTLTEGEKTRLISLARENKGKNAQEFEQFLKDNKLTQADFDKQVLDVGLAFKAAELVLQQTFFNELVNRQMLANAARNDGLYKKALNRYNEFKTSPQYNQVVQVTGFSKDDLKTELVKQELVNSMINEIQSTVPVSNAEIKDLYNKNLKSFQHPERIRLSEIIIPAPSQDQGQILSVKSQIKRMQPKWTAEQIDQAATQLTQQQKSKAETILVQARGGASFAQLANHNDPRAQKSRSGGDIGYREKSQLPPEVADIIWKLKAGDVMQQLLQDPIGFHIMKVTAHESAGPASLSEARDYLRSNIVQSKGGEAVTSWLEKKHKTAKIDFSPKFEALLGDKTKMPVSSLPSGSQPAPTTPQSAPVPIAPVTADGAKH